MILIGQGRCAILFPVMVGWEADLDDLRARLDGAAGGRGGLLVTASARMPRGGHSPVRPWEALLPGLGAVARGTGSEIEIGSGLHARYGSAYGDDPDAYRAIIAQQAPKRVGILPSSTPHPQPPRPAHQPTSHRLARRGASVPIATGGERT